MLTGVYAARNITGEHYDVWSVNTEKEYLEEGRSATLGHGDRLVPKSVTVPVAGAIGELDDDVIEAEFAKLDPLALGVAVGLVNALGLMLATAILLFKDGKQVGRTLSLLSNYVPGFAATWAGAAIGSVEVGIMGFGLGYLVAWLSNRGVQAYAKFVRWRSEGDARRHLLDKV